MTKAVYAGSFDPFTLGHFDIVKQAAPLFDEVTILICNNIDKERMFDSESMKERIIECCSEYPNVKVKTYNGLVANYCKMNDCEYLIRGLRNTNDYLYEENLAKINVEINPDIKIIYFRARNGVISSSFIKELWRYGEDISKYLPKGVYL